MNFINPLTTKWSNTLLPSLLLPLLSLLPVLSNIIALRKFLYSSRCSYEVLRDDWIRTDETSLISTCSSARSPSISATSLLGTTQTYTPETFSRLSSWNGTRPRDLTAPARPRGLTALPRGLIAPALRASETLPTTLISSSATLTTRAFSSATLKSSKLVRVSGRRFGKSSTHSSIVQSTTF